MNLLSPDDPLSRRRLDLIIVFILVAAGLGASTGKRSGFRSSASTTPDTSLKTRTFPARLDVGRLGLGMDQFRAFQLAPADVVVAGCSTPNSTACNAGGYHLTNLLLHLADAVLLFWWLRTATAGGLAERL